MSQKLFYVGNLAVLLGDLSVSCCFESEKLARLDRDPNEFLVLTLIVMLSLVHCEANKGAG